ncbi:MAG TPA: hypothetical protein VLA43_08420 [Longimicrobiales bacterium]|nr:hypothetical protein [Longimicrobiales bacterium]
MALPTVMGLTLLLNVPFGWWREGTRKFSVGWFLAIHLPVPGVVLIRQAFGVRLGWGTLPFLLLAYFAGQFGGARLRRRTAEGWTQSPGSE